MLIGLWMYQVSRIYFFEWCLLSSNSFSFEIVLLFDCYRTIFIGVVCLISGCICIYRRRYILYEARAFYFVIIIFVFVFSILIVICSPNLIRIILGWDGLGLSSYLLVIYYQNFKSYNAGILTILTNRIGDVMILISIGWIFRYRSINYFIYLYYYITFYDYFNLILFRIVLAGITKRAQIPFSAWLPAAIAAPTPVSSLVHSSTLVTAGVYLLIRFSHVFDSWLGEFLLLTAGCTMMMSGVGAFFENDLKKIIALSTLRQLGLIMGSLRLGIVDNCFFHLLSHALFKALLFICAGYIIHCMGGSQDIRIYGGIFFKVPLVIVCFNVANFSLCGFPFLAGFYSKDIILELVLMNEVNFLSLFFFFFATLFTIIYSFRLMMHLIGNSNNYCCHNVVETDYLMIISMLALLAGAVVGGCIIIWIMFPYFYVIILPFYMKIILFFNLFLGVILSVCLYGWSSKTGLVHFLGLMWGIPKVRMIITLGPSLSVGVHYSKYLDQGFVEYIFGKKVISLVIVWSHVLAEGFRGLNYKIYLFFFIYFYLLIVIYFLIYSNSL